MLGSGVGSGAGGSEGVGAGGFSTSGAGGVGGVDGSGVGSGAGGVTSSSVSAPELPRARHLVVDDTEASLIAASFVMVFSLVVTETPMRHTQSPPSGTVNVSFWPSFLALGFSITLAQSAVASEWTQETPVFQVASWRFSTMETSLPPLALAWSQHQYE